MYVYVYLIRVFFFSLNDNPLLNKKTKHDK